MTRRGTALWVAAVALLAAVSGIAVRQWLGQKTLQAVEELYSLSLPDPAGTPQPFNQWRGQVLVVNFWATWCEPCREEVPALVRSHQKWAGKGVQIVGIGIDSAAKIQQFAKEYGVTYPLAVAGLEAVDVSRRLGNTAGALPYTLVLDRHGRVASTHLGGLTQPALDALLTPLAGS
jgi:thiol-disulfide isomerase/thioredoxin